MQVVFFLIEVEYGKNCFFVIFIKACCRVTPYTSPKPPSPSLLLLEKLSVAVAMVARVKNVTSMSSLWLSMFWSIITLFSNFSAKIMMGFTLYIGNKNRAIVKFGLDPLVNYTTELLFDFKSTKLGNPKYQYQ